MPDELLGGTMNATRRVGDTVRRRAGEWTPSVHRYLDHLRACGVDWVPQPLGMDEEGCEVLSYVEGIVPKYPLPHWVWAESVLVDGARRLRELHDASVSLVPADGTWQSPSHQPGEVICHNDFAPHNLAFDRRGRIVGAIDFDMCSPGPRLWDLAYFATRAVPLGNLSHGVAITQQQQRRRIDVVLAAYGSPWTPEDLVRVAIARLLDLAGFSDRAASERGMLELHEHAIGYRHDAWFLAKNLL